MFKNKNKFFQMIVPVLLILSLVLTGCGFGDKEGTKKESNQSESNQKSEAAFPVTVTDGSGEKVTIEKEPKKIISLLPSNTEIAFALGLGEKIVGVSDFDNYPKEVATIEKVGGLEMNVEKILALQPDLALLSVSTNTNYSETVQQLKDAGIAVIVIQDANSFDGAYEIMKLIGKVTGTEQKAEKIIGSMKTDVENLKKLAGNVKSKKKVWLEVSPSPEIYTTGQGTFMDEMLQIINAENIASDKTGWVMMNEEEVVSLNPDVAITTYGDYVDNPEEQVYSRVAWKEVTAIKDKQVFDVDSDTVTRPGPRLIDGVKSLGKAIYPDIFKE